METKVVQCLTPQDLKTELDLIIAADEPTFIHVVEMASARTHFVICWIPGP
jgi:hypothetical protein